MISNIISFEYVNTALKDRSVKSRYKRASRDAQIWARNYGTFGPASKGKVYSAQERAAWIAEQATQ